MYELCRGPYRVLLTYSIRIYRSSAASTSVMPTWYAGRARTPLPPFRDPAFYECWDSGWCEHKASCFKSIITYMRFQLNIHGLKTSLPPLETWPGPGPPVRLVPTTKLCKWFRQKPRAEANIIIMVNYIIHTCILVCLPYFGYL